MHGRQFRGGAPLRRAQVMTLARDDRLPICLRVRASTCAARLRLRLKPQLRDRCDARSRCTLT